MARLYLCFSTGPHRPSLLLFILPVFFSFFAPSPGSSKPSNTAGFQFQDPPQMSWLCPSPLLSPLSYSLGAHSLVHRCTPSLLWTLFPLHLLHLYLLYWFFKPHHGCGSTPGWLLNRWSNKIFESLIFLGDIWHALHRSILLGVVIL